MSYRFSPNKLIVVTARLEGPNGQAFAQLLLDTGAQYTLVSEATADEIGLIVEGSRTIYGVSGPTRMGLAAVRRVDSIGLARQSFQVGVYTLPRVLGIDGLLGLDFLRDSRVTIDFRSNLLTVG